MFGSLFGPSKKEIWRQLSERVHGRFVEGGFCQGDKVEVTHADWTVTLDTYAISTGKVTMVFTRMQAPFANPTKFRFTIYRGGFWAEVGKFFGMQDLEVGDPPFDDAFVVKGADEPRVKLLFANPRIRELLTRQPEIHLTVESGRHWPRPKQPEGVDVLVFHVGGIIKDIDRLELLYDLFGETLDELARAG
jgi:hypothetical protein